MLILKASSNRILSATSCVLVLLGFMVPGPAAAASASCDGNAATITSSSLIIKGTSGDDVIVVLGAGTHTIKAGSGDDLICSGSSSDSIFGGPGNDSLQGGAGLDTLSPGKGSNSCALDNPDQVIGACSVDDVIPQVSNVSVINPVFALQVSNVSVSNQVSAGSKAIFTWSITDTTGVDYTDLRIGGPSGWINWCGFPIEGTRISGDAQQGTYSAECDIPETAVNTTYTAFIIASDYFGNSSYGTSADFTVTGGIADDAEPTVNSVEVSSSALVLGEEFTVTYRATDESGVKFIYGYFYHDGSGVAGERGTWITPGALNEPVSGDEKAGVWQQSFTVNDFAPIGTYTLYVGRSDIYGNRNFTESDIRITVSSQ